jgi:hypothetical protein
MAFLMAQANFEPTFSCINTSTILKPSYYSSYTPAYECSETSAYKIQTLRNYPEKKKKHTTFLKMHSEKVKIIFRYFFTNVFLIVVYNRIIIDVQLKLIIWLNSQHDS